MKIDSFGGGGYVANEMGGAFTSPGGTTGTPGGKDSKVQNYNKMKLKLSL